MQVQEWIIERQQLLERIKELQAEYTKRTVPFSTLSHQRLPDNLCFSVESTDFGCQRVEVVKATVVAVRWHVADSPHRI